MDYTIILSIVGSIASIISLVISFFRESKNNLKLLLTASFIAFTYTSIYIANIHSEIEKMQKIKESALTLMNEKIKFSDRGFVYAGLSFLETNKEIYPDTYKRAISITNKMENSSSIYAEMDASNTMKDILHGIAILNKKE